LPSMDPATHVFVMWEGWYRAQKMTLGSAFVRSTTTEVVVVVQEAASYGITANLREHGFGDLQLIADPIPVQLLEREATQLRAYILRRASQHSIPLCHGKTNLLDLPGIATEDEVHAVKDLYGLRHKALEYTEECKRVGKKTTGRQWDSYEDMDEFTFSMHLEYLDGVEMLGEAATRIAKSAKGGARFIAMAVARMIKEYAEIVGDVIDSITENI
jgi:hypothetical protein